MRWYVLLFLGVVAAAALAQHKLTTIPINFANPEQIVDVIKPWLSADSSVSLYRNQLILNVTEEELARTRELLEQLDGTGRQLLVSLRSEGSGTESRRGVDVDTVIKSGDTTITTGPRGGTNETKTTVRVQNYRGASTDNGNQSVRVTEGMPAFIATGVTAPVHTYTTGLDGRRYSQQDYVNAVSGFYATTWVNDEVVSVHIEQSNDQLEGRTIATQQLQSQISGRLGQWIPIGSIDSTTVQNNQNIGSREQSSRDSSTQLYIKVEVLK